MTDQTYMEGTSAICSDADFPECLPIMQLKAYTVNDGTRLKHYFSGALCSAGGWLLRSEELAGGGMRWLFEFERSAAADIYAMLMGLGIELTSLSHQLLAGFYQRTVHLGADDRLQVATCELEVEELAMEAYSSEPLFGISSNA